MADIAQRNPVQVIRYYRGLQVLMDITRPSETRTKPNVFFFWGAPGCGKSCLAHHLYPSAYSAGDYKEAWMDNYAGELEIIFDDFKGVFPLGAMLKLLDRYKLQLPKKGGFVPIRANTFCFTANEPPSGFYGGDAAWIRRIVHEGTVWGEADIVPRFAEALAEIEMQQQNEKDGLAPLPLVRENSLAPTIVIEDD